eukprot:2203229-Rhodomonas_salina.7
MPHTDRKAAAIGHALNIVNFKYLASLPSVLCLRYAVPGPEIASAAIRDRTFGRAVKHGGDNRTGMLRYRPTRLLCNVRYCAKHRGHYTHRIADIGTAIHSIFAMRCAVLR